MAKNLLRAGVVWRILALSIMFVRQVTSDSSRKYEHFDDCLSQW